MSANGPAGQEAILAILEKLPASVVISDFDTGEILWTNAWNIEIASASHPDELIGRSLLEFVTPEDLGRALEAIETTRKGGNPGPLTCRIRRLDGTRADAQISSVTIRFDGRTAMLSLLSDVTAVEQAMRDLAESEERYRMLVETSPDGIAVCVDNDIAYVNPTLAEALGCKSGEELVGKSMFDFIDPADHRGVRDAKKHLFLTKRPHPTAPITLLRKDGGRLLSAAQTTLVRWRGMQATQTLLRDIASSMEPPTGPIE